VRDSILAPVGKGLDTGRVAAKTLTESLGVDHVRLMKTVRRQFDLEDEIVDAVEALAGLGFMKRMRGAAAAVRHALRGHPQRRSLVRALSNHPSDTVRGWTVFALTEATSRNLEQRLAAARPFAADAHFNVREYAWFGVRDALAAELDKGIRLLRPWVREEDQNLRRFAIELTRPRGVWCMHIPALKKDPTPGLPLLEPLRSDPARYVQNSVANWLNDASKSSPLWVHDLCKRWQAHSKSPATAYITRRAMRRIRY